MLTLQKLFSRVLMTIVMGSSGCIILEVRKERLFHVFCVAVLIVGGREETARRYVLYNTVSHHDLALYVMSTNSKRCISSSDTEIRLPRLWDVLRLLGTCPGSDPSRN